MDRCTVVVATDDLSIGIGAVLSGSFGVLLVGSGKKIAKDEVLYTLCKTTCVTEFDNEPPLSATVTESVYLYSIWKRAVSEQQCN